MNCAQADGIAALAVGSALLLGLYAKRQGSHLGDLTTTMLGSAQQSMIALNTDYEGRAEVAAVDSEFLGLHALYRLYEAADGWVFLAAPLENEWSVLTAALGAEVDLASDARFATQSLRRENDAALTEILEGVFSQRPKDDWERELTALDVGCVAAAEQNLEWLMQDDEFFEAGYCVEAVSPIFDEHRRLAPITRFSRSLTKADAGCSLGEHTGEILRGLGYSDDQIADLKARSIVGGD